MEISSFVSGSPTDKGVDVNDYTDINDFLSVLIVTLGVVVDSALTTLINLVVFTVFLFTGAFCLPFIEFLSYYKKGSSAVNPDPRIHEWFANTSREHWKDVFDKLDTPARNFDFDLAEFHLHLSALAYESNETIKKYLLKPEISFGRDFKSFKLSRHRYIIVWSVQKNFVEVVFKGTSPYDLSEWMVDCTVRKKIVKNGVLPGLLHSGFYNAFSLNEDGLDVYESLREIHQVYFANKKPNLWITGHSLGAALATVFTSILLWRKSSIGKACYIPNMDWEDKFTLCGTYTFGNPRVGDMSWKEEIEEIWEDYNFQRVINANDIVCSLPLAHSVPMIKSFAGEFTSLSDLEHIGDPILLPYRGGKHETKERTFYWYLWNAPRFNTFGDICLFPLNVLTCGLLGGVLDHIPNEYLANLKSAAAAAAETQSRPLSMLY